MNNKGRLFTILLIFLLGAISFLQYLRYVQSERLVSRFDLAIERVERQSISTDVSNEVFDTNFGDWLVWAFAVEPKTLNPISVERDIYARWMCVDNIFEPLLTYDFDTVELKPHLAERYEISGDGLEITFYIRDEAKFSDGAAVGADDVIFTYQTIMNPQVDAADLANMFAEVRDVVKINDKAVKFFMKRPYFKALEVVSFWDIGIFPKHIYEFKDAKEFNQRISNPVGSGPYVFEKWQTGSEVVFKRNENYWGKKPKLEKLVWRFIKNDVARVQALKSGQVDMIIPSQEQFADLVDNQQFARDFSCVYYWNPGVPFYYIGWNQKNTLFKDKLVRRAMTHLVYRDSMIKHLLKGYAEITTGPFYTKGGQYDPNIVPWPYDLKESERLLDEAGWIDSDGDGIRDKDGIKFSFKFMYDGSNIFVTQLVKMVKDSAANVGVDVVPDPQEWSVMIGKITDRDFDAMLMGWGGDILQDPFQLWHSSQADNRGSNYVGFKNAMADELIEQIRASLDENKRNRLSKELHRILHDEQPYTFLYIRPTVRIIDKRFENVKIHKLGINILEWYVPKDKQKY